MFHGIEVESVDEKDHADVSVLFRNLKARKRLQVEDVTLLGPLMTSLGVSLRMLSVKASRKHLWVDVLAREARPIAELELGEL